MGSVRMTRRGQVTIPKTVREALGLKPFDRIDMIVVDGEVRLGRLPTLAELAGSVPALDPPIDPDEAIRIAKEARALRWRENHGL
jgi:antitoxin PrlF